MRELNRVVQDLRKDAGYAVSDRIEIAVEGDLDEVRRERLYQLALATPGEVSKADLSTDVTVEDRGDLTVQ